MSNTLMKRYAVVQRGTMRLLVGSIAIGAIGIAVMCAKERGLNSIPTGERLYVTAWGGDEARIHIFDTKADSLIDSTDAVVSNTLVRASSDGKYFFRWNYPPCAEVWNAATIQKLADFPGCGAPVPTDGHGPILGMRPRAVDYVFQPDFKLTGSDVLVFPGEPSVGGFKSIVDTKRGVVFFTLTYSDGTIDSMDIAAWDYKNRQPYGFWNLRQALNAGTRIVRSFTINPGSDNLFLIASPDSRLYCLDLQSNLTKWYAGIQNAFGLCQVTPDGREVWRAHRGMGAFSPNLIPAIYIHDAATGEIRDSVSLQGLISRTDHFPSIEDLVFTQDGSKAYASAGDVFNIDDSGPVYIIDVKARRIIGTLLDDGGHYPYYMDIGPAP